MLTLFIDESGQFENNNDIKNVVVGGVLIKHETVEELNNISNDVESEFIDIYGSNYENFIHGDSRNIIKQRDVISRIINSGGKFKYITPTFMAKGEVNRLINSNITDDNTAGMLYFNMVNSFVSTILLHYPEFEKTEKELNIFIASRIATEHALSGNKRLDLESIGMDKVIKPNGSTIYFLNNQTSILINLHNELSNYSLIKEPLDVKIKKKVINYDNREEQYMNMFYLADIVCNEVYNKRKMGRNHDFSTAISFFYDDINNEYKKIYKDYAEGRLYEFLDGCYDFNVKFQENKFKKVYDNYIRILKKNVNKIISRDSIRDTLYSVKEFSAKGKYDRKKVLYLLTFLKDYLKELSHLNIIVFYELLLRVYNHMGLVTEATKTYNDLMDLAIEFTSLEMLDRKRSFLNLYTSILVNRFDFKEALEIIENLIDSELIIQEALLNIEAGLFDKVTAVDKGMQLGKYYSAKAQFLSFLNDPAALESYELALSCLEDHPRNKSQTTSYLVHFLCDHIDIQITSEIKGLLNDYFTGEDFSARLDFLLQEDKYLKVNRSYELFALLKLYLFRYPDEIEYSMLDRLVKKVLSIPEYKLQHPWELIFFTLAKLYLEYDKDLSEKLVKRALENSLINSEQVTIYLIGLMIKVETNRSIRAINEFINYVENVGQESLNSYFEIEKLKSEGDMEDKVELILSKFKFTYH